MSQDEASDSRRYSESPMRLVEEFHRKYGLSVRTSPSLNVPREEIDRLPGRLEEELGELKDAVTEKRPAAIARELGDLVYLAYGAALELGFDLDRVLRVIHRANLTRENSDGTIVRSADGKVVPGSSYMPPDVAAELGLDPDACYQDDG